MLSCEYGNGLSLTGTTIEAQAEGETDPVSLVLGRLSVWPGLFNLSDLDHVLDYYVTWGRSRSTQIEVSKRNHLERSTAATWNERKGRREGHSAPHLRLRALHI